MNCLFNFCYRYWTAERPRGVQSHYHAVRRMCRERGVLFEDREFPPGPRVLFHHKKPPVHPIVWMRPGVSDSTKTEILLIAEEGCMDEMIDVN